MNQIKTVVLLGTLTGLIVLLGGAIGGRGGMMVALLLAAAMNFFSYWYSDKIVLAMYQAQPVDERQTPASTPWCTSSAPPSACPCPEFTSSRRTPPTPSPPADPEHAVVAVTSGTLRILNPRELRGVISHELAHVQNRDILVSSVAATLAGAVMVLANLARWGAIFGGGRNDEEGGGGMVGMILMSILAPVAAFLIQMAVSRSREYLADQEGAAMSRDPEALAAALGKLEQVNQVQPMQGARPQTAHMFIVNPLSGASLMGLFCTHPPMAERMARLRQMASQGYQQPYAPPPLRHMAVAAA
ncbi:Protease HtpX homolog [Desulfarculales bacterium]